MITFTIDVLSRTTPTKGLLSFRGSAEDTPEYEDEVVTLLEDLIEGVERRGYAVQSNIARQVDVPITRRQT